jgi:hypothetical protein
MRWPGIDADYVDGRVVSAGICRVAAFGSNYFNPGRTF